MAVKHQGMDVNLAESKNGYLIHIKGERGDLCSVTPKNAKKNFSHYLQKLFRISNLALLRARRSTTAVFLNGVKQSKSLCISSAYFYNS